MAYIRPFRGGKWRVEVDRHGQRLSKVVDTEDEAKLWAQHTTAQLDSQKARYKPRERLVQTGPDLVTIVPKIVLEASRAAPHSQYDVLEAAIPTARASGVYFLIRLGEVVYVGQSVDVLHRIARHRREGKVFDAFSYIECEPAELDRLESIYIRAFVPQENLTFGNREGKARLHGARRRAPQSEPTADSEGSR